MPVTHLFARLPALLLPLALLVAGATDAVAQEKVGVNAAVNTEATGTPPGGATRRLVIGENVVFNERIQTSASGQTQVMFVDESTMTVGPNSDITVDRFVYDPRSGTGTMALSMTKGVMRLVGGKLTKQAEPMTVRTQNATIALRGGIMLADAHAGERLDAALLFGKEMTVAGRSGAAQTVTAPGFAITVAGPGTPASAPYRLPPAVLAGILVRLDGQPQAHGGARNVPTDATVAGSGVENTISGNLPQSVQQAAAQTSAQQPQVTTTNPATTTQTQAGNTAPQVIDCTTGATGCNPQSAVTVGTTQSGQPVGGTATQPTTTPTPTPSTTPTSPPPGPVVITYAGLAKSIQDPSLGFVNQDSQHRIPFTNATLTYPAGQPQQGVLNVALSNGVTVTSPLPPGSNTVQGSSNQGPFTAKTFLSADQTFFYANATGSGTNSNGNSNGVAFIFGGQPVNQTFYQPTAANQFYAFNLQPDAALQSAIPFVPAQFGGNTPNAVVSPLLLATPANTQFGAFNPNTNPNGGPGPNWLQSSIAFNGSGSSQSSVFVVNTGDFFTSSDTGKVAGAGPVRGSYLAAGTATPVRLGSFSATVPDGNGNNLFGTNTITGFVLDQNSYNQNLNFQQQLAAAAAYGQPATNYAFNVPAVAAGTPTIGSRTNTGGTGFFGGIMYPNFPGSGQGSPYVLVGPTNVSPNASANRVQAIFNGFDPFTPSQSGISSMNIAFGSISGRNFARSTFIDNTHYAAAESPSIPSSINGTNLPVGPGVAFSPQLGLVTSGVVNNVLPNGVTPCACQYLQWGYWTGELDTPNAQQTAATRQDRANINTWLAGTPTAVSDINVLQGQAFTGTYAGHAVGSVFNNGVSYAAAGGFNGTYNFGTNVGTFQLSNFDGKTVAGTIAGSGGFYGGNVSNPVLNGTVNGRFFGPMAAETGGYFGVKGVAGGPLGNYLASGIFAGKQ